MIKEGSAATDGREGSVPWGEVILGDCLEVAGRMLGGSFDLIYADPPFFTNREQIGNAKRPPPEMRNAKQEVIRNTELQFADRWGERADYLAWLRPRVVALRKLLKPGGAFLLHLDWHAVHYAKVMCDQNFEEAAVVEGGSAGRFENELIWYYQTGGASKGRFSRKHDTILLYSNGGAVGEGGRGGFYFDGKAVAIPRTAKAMKRAQCATGARIAADDTHKNPDDVITIPALNPMALERTGYPTQKPVALLEMLIQALCPLAGSVADLFCGSGTTLVAAERLGRRWVGCDSNQAAVDLARRRVAEGQNR